MIQRREKSGMTLIEVTLATTILVVGLTALLTGASRCLSVMKSSKRYQDAVWTLERGMLDYPLFVTNDVKSLEVDGVSYDEYEFRRIVEDDEDEDKLYLVRTEVSWLAGDRRMVEEVLQYVLETGDDD